MQMQYKLSVKQAEIVQTREVYETRRLVAYSEMGLVGGVCRSKM